MTRKEYNENPKLCAYCGEPIILKSNMKPWEALRKVCCSRSCATSFRYFIKYAKMNEIGPNSIKYLKETKSIIKKDGKKERKANFLCHCGNEFEALISNVKRGATSSCGCNRVGYDKESWVKTAKNEATLYIIQTKGDEEFIKIGITFYPLTFRLNAAKFPYTYRIIKEIKGLPEEIWEEEKQLHRFYRQFQYTPKIYFSGYSECFNIDIIESLDSHESIN